MSFSYNKKEAVLQNINIDVAPGQVIALVGESGSGKSTFMQLLYGFYTPTKGTLTIDGHEISKYNLTWYRQNIATVPQDLTLFNDTLLYNVTYGARKKPTAVDLEKMAKLAHVKEFKDRLLKKWQTKVGNRGVRLSGGQKQRVAIMRAILQDPKILIMDEPTSALDAQSEVIIQSSLDKLMADRTVFIAAHRLSTVAQADLILVFKNGRIVERGNHGELLKKKGYYHNLVKLQNVLS